MEIACLDLEGVLVPEIWIAFAEKTGIDALKATTRDIPDYDVLMKQRLRILDEHGLKPVSYTHLDVYKRQREWGLRSSRLRIAGRREYSAGT